MSNDNEALLAFFSHHKCASSWILRNIWNFTADRGYKTRLIRGTDSKEQVAEVFSSNLNKDTATVALTNARWDMVSALPEFRGFHVVRDPRDMLVSAYFSHLKSHKVYENTPQVFIEHREKLKSLSLEAGLLAEITGPMKDVFHDMREWNPEEEDGIIEVKMEDLTANPAEEFQRIFEALDIPVTSEFFPLWWLRSRCNQYAIRKFGKGVFKSQGIDIKSLKWHTERLAFSKLTGRKKGEENTNSHLRKGVAGDWVNYFSPELKQIFNEKQGDLLIKYGYEESNDWLRAL